MIPNPPDSCSSCKFWEPNAAKNNMVGDCHLTTPQVVVTHHTLPLQNEDPDNITLTLWPTTMPEQACGSFEKMVPPAP